MQKIFFILIIIIFLFFFIPADIVSADYKTEVQQQLGAAAGQQGANFGTANDPRLVVAYVIQIMLGLLGIGFVAYGIYAGVLIMTSGGDEEKVKKGKGILRNAVLGVIIILSAYGITLLVYRVAMGDVWHIRKLF